MKTRLRMSTIGDRSYVRFHSQVYPTRRAALDAMPGGKRYITKTIDPDGIFAYSVVYYPER